MSGKSEKVPGKMLKLLKNDFLASSRVISLFYLVEVVALLAFFVGKKMDNTKVTAIGASASVLVCFLLIFVSFFFVVYDFNKSMFGQQGYLTFSLPVSSNQLLGSKMIVYGAWMIVSFFVFILVLLYFSKYVETDVVGEETMGTAETLMALFNFPSKAQIITYAVYIIAYFFILVLAFVSMIYFALAASHMRPFQKSNIMWAIIIFIANCVVMSIIISSLEKAFDLYLVLYEDKSFGFIVGMPTVGTPLTITPALYFIVQGIALFYGTSYIMHKKINIK